MAASGQSVKVLVLLSALSCIRVSHGLIDIGPGSASFSIPFLNVGFSVCHQSTVCGVNGKTYKTPCALAEDNVEMACRRPCPCQQGSGPKPHQPKPQAPPKPPVEDVWFAEPTAIIITPPPPAPAGPSQPQSPSQGHGKSGGGGSNTNKCSQHADPGPCQPDEYHVQYYYDFNRGSCSPFLYGGCEGNSNRFSSRQECVDTCGHHGGDGNRKLKLR